MNYTITIRNEGGGSSSSSPVAGNQQPATQQAPAKNSKTPNPDWVKGLVAYNQYLKPFVSQVIQHEVGTVSLRTGSQELQQKVEFAYNAVSEGISLAESIAVGAIIGKGVVGALLGAVMGVATSAVGYINRRKTIGYNQSLEDISIDLMNTRAGGAIYSSFSGSRGNRQ